MKHLTYILSALVIAASSPSHTTAQPDHWESTGGPLGGAIRAFLIDGETTYAGTLQGGIFASPDLGENWSRQAAGDAFEAVNAFVKNSEGDLFAATTSGVRRSTDGGMTWDLFTNGLPPRPNLNTITVNTDDHLFVGGSTGVLRSIDNGESWSESNVGLTDKFIRCMLVAPDGTLYVGTSHGAFASSDSGDTWLGIGPAATFQSMLVENDGTLWGGGTNGLWRNPDGTWTKVREGDYISIVDLPGGAILAGGNETLAITTDDGDTWSDYSLDTEAATNLRALVRSESMVLAGTDQQGIYRSQDAGQSWQHANTGLDATLVQDLDADASGRLFAVTNGGVFRSLDGGATWSLRLGLVGAESVIALSTGLLLAGTSTDGIYRSVDGGGTWSATDPRLVYALVRSFAEAPNGHLFAGANTGLIYRSVDEGVTWDSVALAGTYVEVSALAANADGTVLAGWDQGVLRSTDDGTTWEDASVGFPADLFPSDLMFLPEGDVLVSSQKGVFRSNNGGASWTLSGSVPLEGARDLVRDSEGTIYCAVRGGGVAVSMDGALSWTSIVLGLNGLDATSLAIVPSLGKGGGTSAGEDIFVGTRGGGVEKLAFSTVSVKDDALPASSAIRLGSNYPNPFHGSTTFPIELAETGRVTLRVFDLLGREVQSIRDRLLPAGRSSLDLEAGDLAPGIYLYEATSGSQTVRGAMVLSE